MENLEHIGIAVRDLKESIPRYELLLSTPCYKTQSVESQQVITAFFKLGTTKIELLQPIGQAGPVFEFLKKRGEGMHHMAFAVKDIRAEMQRLASAGFQLLSEEPLEGADDKWVCFIHPRDASGVLTELVQDR